MSASRRRRLRRAAIAALWLPLASLTACAELPSSPDDDSAASGGLIQAARPSDLRSDDPAAPSAGRSGGELRDRLEFRGRFPRRDTDRIALNRDERDERDERRRRRGPDILRTQTDAQGIGLLLPLSAASSARNAAQSLRNAALMAVIDHGGGDRILLIRDTGGSPEGAGKAARQLLEDDVRIIVGPLLADAARAIKNDARKQNVPILSLAADPRLADDNLFSLGDRPEDEIDLVIAHAASRGLQSFAALIPDHPYGDRSLGAFRKAVQRNRGRIVAVQRFQRNFDDVGQAVDALIAQIASPIPRAADAGPEEPRLHQPHVDAVFIADGGDLLIAAAALLTFNFGERKPQLLGAGLWDDPEIRSEPSLRGGWYAATAKKQRGAFNRRYRQTYDAQPHALAALGYDAVAVALAALAENAGQRRRRQDRLTSEKGFEGIDGRLQFFPNGHVRRELNVKRINADGLTILADNLQ